MNEATRTKMIARLRALLAKTTANGCTEGEMLLALEKAAALRAEYAISDNDLTFAGEKPELSTVPLDRNGIKINLCVNIARFCEVRVWKDKRELKFLGLRSDTDFALWLLDTLSAFVERECAFYMQTYFGDSMVAGRNGFILGACSRISERLRELSTKPAGTGLVLAKQALIADALRARGITLHKGRNSHGSYASDSHADGRATGDRASFGRPVSGNAGGPRLLGGH